MTATGTQSPPAPTSTAHRAQTAIRSLAADDAFHRRSEELNELADAVASDGDYRGWDRVDLSDAFSPGSTISVPHSTRLERLLGTLAGASVFVPIAWTWWSLREASEAYDAAIASGAAEGQSFLQMWVSGFGGELSGLHDLGTVTFVSVVMIIAAITLFVLHKLVADRAIARHDGDYAEAEARLASALALANRAFGESILSHGQSIEAILQASLNELKQAHEDTRLATEGFTGAAEQLSTTVARAETLISQTLSKVDDVVDGLNGSARQLTAASADVRTAVEEARDGTADSLGQLGTSLQNAVKHYQEETAADLSEAVAGMRASQEAMKEFTTSLRAEARQAQDDLDQLRGEIVGFASTSTEQVNRQLDGVRGVTHQLELTSQNQAVMFQDLTAALNSVVAANQEQRTELTWTKDLLDNWSRERLTAEQNGGRR